MGEPLTSLLADVRAHLSPGSPMTGTDVRSFHFMTLQRNSTLPIKYRFHIRFGSLLSLKAHSRPLDCIHIGARLITPDRISKLPPTPIAIGTLSGRMYSSMRNSCFGAPRATKIICGLAFAICSMTGLRVSARVSNPRLRALHLLLRGRVAARARFDPLRINFFVFESRAVNGPGEAGHRCLQKLLVVAIREVRLVVSSS